MARVLEQGWLRSLLGFALFFILWETAGRTGALGASFPSLSEIATAFDTPVKRGLFTRSMAVTVHSSLIAFAVGAAIAVGLALISAVLPSLENGINSLASGIYAIPAIAFGPILILIAGPETTPIVLGVLSAFFPIYGAFVSGLRFTPSAYLDLSGALGASRARAFLLLKVPHAMPALIDGLRLGAPGAILGVVLGEWFGAPRGLGVVIVGSMQNVRIPQLWAAALLVVACSLIAYFALSALHRLCVRRFAW